jgi:DNA-binding NarL/FixJ family response regulator
MIVRVLLLDGRRLIRAAMHCLLNGAPGVEVVASTGSVTDALAVVGREGPAVVLLVADDHPGINGIGSLMKAAGFAAKVVVLTSATDPESHGRFVRCGAAAIVGTDSSAETLFTALRRVAQGETWMDRRCMAGMPTIGADGRAVERARIGSLTRRERQVVALVCEGLRNKAIAERLSVTDVTVRHHLTAVFSKLGVADRLSLLVYASRNGLGPSLARGTVPAAN